MSPSSDVTEGNVQAGYGVTAHGDPNANVTAVLNLPIIEGIFAVRGVVYDDHRGGYINNVPATFTRKNTDLGIADEGYGGYPTGCVPGTDEPLPGTAQQPRVINNGSVVGNAINSTDYTGNARRGARTRSTTTGTCCSASRIRTSTRRASFTSSPTPRTARRSQPLEVTLFNPAYDKDRFESTALDRERQDLGYQGRLYRRVPRPPCQPARRLHELRPRLLCRLLSVPWPDNHRRFRLLLAECHQLRQPLRLERRNQTQNLLPRPEPQPPKHLLSNLRPHRQHHHLAAIHHRLVINRDPHVRKSSRKPPGDRLIPRREKNLRPPFPKPAQPHHHRLSNRPHPDEARLRQPDLTLQIVLHCVPRTVVPAPCYRIAKHNHATYNAPPWRLGA